jgi:hypothetical protein
VRDVVLISIKPEFAEEILGGQRRVEFRKTRPSFGPGTRAVIYASSPKKCVVGVFEVARVVQGTPKSLWGKANKYSGGLPLRNDRLLRELAMRLRNRDLVVAAYENTTPPERRSTDYDLAVLDKQRKSHHELIKLASASPPPGTPVTQ